MARIRVRAATAAAVCAAVAFAVPAPAANPTPAFGRPAVLTGYQSGEPSMAFDPSGNGDLYVVAPQSVPAVANGGSTTRGVALWASHDGGRSFGKGINVGSYAGGGDSDVDVTPGHDVYIADLEIAGNAICVSHDRGKTFVNPVTPNACDGAATDHQGPVSDREWIDHGPDGELYLTYHDIHIELPVVEKSTDQGKTFVRCGSVMDPRGDSLTSFTPGPTSGTQVPKPVIGHDGSVSVLFAESAPANAGTGFSMLYLATAATCDPATTFVNHLVYGKPGANLSNPFDGLTADGAGNLYVVATGKLSAAEETSSVWLFVSRDHGTTWTKPTKVNRPSLAACALPAIAGGPRAGQIAVGWYATTHDDQVRYYVGTSFDYGAHFTTAATTTQPVHTGTVDRGWALDYTSIAVEPRTGAVVAVYAAQPGATGQVWVSRQNAGRNLR